MIKKNQNKREIVLISFVSISEKRSGLYHANFADVQMDELNLGRGGREHLEFYNSKSNKEIPTIQPPLPREGLLHRVLQADVLPRGSMQAVRALLASRILVRVDISDS